MTLRKKLWITIACLSVILCTLVTGTIAWLTDKTTEITNTFTPSNIDVELVEENHGTDYKFQMIPGKTYAKDPKVTVTNDIPCYVFVKIEEKNNFANYMEYAIASGWKPLTDGVYYRDDLNNTTEPVSVLANNQIKVKDAVTKAMMEALFSAGADKYPTLTFTAYACQLEGFENNVKGAWEAASANPNP